MNDLIDNRSFELLIRVADQKGIPEHCLTQGLGFTHAELLKKRGHVTWDQFATYCERFEKLIGGPDETLEIGKYLVQTRAFAPLLQFGGLLASPKWFYQFITDWFAPMMTPAITNLYQRYLDAHTFELKLATPNNGKDCPAVFRIIASMLRHGPTIVGIQPSVVTLNLTAPRQACYIVQFSPSMTVFSRAKRAIHNTLYGQNVIEELAAQHQSLLNNFEKLRRSEKNFRLLVNNSPDGILIYSPDKILFANPAIAHFLNAKNPEQLTGMSIQEVCKHPQELAIWENPEVQTRYTKSLPFRQIHGGEVWAETNAFRAHFNGEAAFVCITRDITERKNVLARAAEMDRMISMGILAAGIGHEIRNPLSYLLANITYTQTSIDDLCNKIRETIPQNDDQADWLLELNEIADAMASALSGTQRIIEISKDLSSFSRNDNRQFEPVPIQDSITAALNIARHEIRHRAGILTKISVNPAVHTNATQLSQVILNLLINSAQSIPTGDVEQNQITIRTFLEQDQACIEITDTGCGIPPDILEHIFTPFFTTKPPGEGTGLGLPISKNIIEELGGSLSITSKQNQGTCALISLPLHNTKKVSQTTP